MTGCIVQVWFEADNDRRQRPPPFQIIETELPDFATFCEMVDGDRLISGAIIYTHKELVDGYKVIRNRTPTAFRGSTVMRALLPTWKFAEES
jgi:hypothetical protein